jgi:hypothetical protein
MSQFQMKYSKKDDWKEVPERIVLEKLVDEFGRVTPFLDKMMRGQEIDLTHCIFRMKNSVTNKKGYLASLSIINKTPEDDN